MNDSHLHLQDPRLQERELSSIISQMRSVGIKKCVVNGTYPGDWNIVQQLSHQHPDFIIPSYGLHPWKTNDQFDHWKEQLTEISTQSPIPCIGECGLDRWMHSPNKEKQEEVFLFQLSLATQLNAPLSIHILKAWGWFLDILRKQPFPKRGFLLHSYNGSLELLPELIKAGAYFSFSGYYLHDKKMKQQAVFKAIPKERLLIETDAPDMLPPEHAITHRLDKLNHPANLPSISQHLADLLKTDHETLNNQLDHNFSDFFLK